MEQCLLVIIVTPAMENSVVDWLLERDDITGFTSIPVSGHGTSVHALTPAEQVCGRQKQIMFQIQLQEIVAQEIITTFTEAFTGSGMHYWLTPVLKSGHID